MSKIHCIMLVRNEADVIAYTLREASRWADFVYVYDNTSTDGTWEIVKSMANGKIIAWKQHQNNYREGLLANVFNEFRHLSEEGDWWMKLDADDFYDPKFRTRIDAIPEGHTFVWTITLDYQLTHKDLEQVDFSQPADKVLPQLRYYRPAFSEPRLFRYRKRLVWTTETAWPRHPGLTAFDRPLMKHYPHRSPQQIQTRLDIRREQKARGYTGWENACQLSWREKIVDPRECLHDDGSGKFTIDESKLPWHLEPFHKRLMKAALHGTGVWA